MPWRPCDNFGIGWARTELSDNFVPFLRQQLRLGLGHEDAIEMYYNAAITPWLNAALDLQIIDQALERTLDASGSQAQGHEHRRGARAARLRALLSAEPWPHQRLGRERPEHHGRHIVKGRPRCNCPRLLHMLQHRMATMCRPARLRWRVGCGDGGACPDRHPPSWGTAVRARRPRPGRPRRSSTTGRMSSARWGSSPKTEGGCTISIPVAAAESSAGGRGGSGGAAPSPTRPSWRRNSKTPSPT